MSIQTPLHALHLRHGGKMIDFADYALPVFYTNHGLLVEHHHTRNKASIFDVSHMGQISLPADDTTTAALSALLPADLSAIAEGASKYTVLTNAAGGAIDDCIISNDGARGWFIVINASRKDVDIAHIRAAMPDASKLHEYTDRALIAVQGPAAAAVVGEHFPQITTLKFMRSVWAGWNGAKCRISRCGYTGEDGFEISVPTTAAEALTEALLANAAVQFAGLGARDSLRLESGLCLYGNELDEATSPIEAGLLWAIPKSRRDSTAYLGASVIQQHIANGAPRRLIGLLPQGKTPVRKGAMVSVDGNDVGMVTSGVFSPTLSRPIALAYVQAEMAEADNLIANVRGKEIPCTRTSLPFIPHQYIR